jgi:hypothetical protein
MLLVNPQTIRERFGNKPITLMRLVSPSVKFPKKLRMIFSYLWLQRGPDNKKANRFIIKGPRGGGKTLLVGAVGFARWLLQCKSAVAMGGSMTQAQNVYNYFAGHCYAHHSITEGLPKEPTMHLTESDKGNYFKAVAASPKQIRGPHPDDLYIDEACEAKDEIIMSALPMVSSSPDPLVVMTSTFHKIFGYFQETWDDALKLGYTRLSWDIFDVCRTFSLDIFDDPDLNRDIPDLDQLKKRVGNRRGDPEGWVRIENIIQAWREKPSLDWFDVEYMGTRPSASGLVNDPADVDACTIVDLKGYGYKKGATVIGGLDWGYSGMTAWVNLMQHTNETKIQINNRNYSQVALDVIIKDIVEDVEKYGIEYIYADSAGKFENVALQNALTNKFRRTDFKCVVIEVVFSKEKFGTAGPDGAMSMFGNYRAHIQRHKLKIPKTQPEAIWQHKRYKYQKNSDKPEKKDDHIPDATMCCLKHWELGRHSYGIPKGNLKEEVAEYRGEEVVDDYSPFTAGLMDEIF